MIIYILILLSAIMFAFLSQSSVEIVGAESSSTKKYGFNQLFFTISFLILFIFSALAKNGPDIPAYVSIYNNVNLNDLADFGIEAGYELLCIVLRVIIKNPYVGIGVIKFISLYMIYRAIYLLKHKIRVGFAVAGYVILLYLLSFFLLRIMLAIGMVYLALAYEVIGKRKNAILFLIFAFLFHYTSIVVFIAYIIYILLGTKLTVKKILLFGLCGFTVTLVAKRVISVLVSLIPVMEKYKTYGMSNDNNGIGQLILFLPIVYLIFCFNRTEKSDKFYRVGVVSAIMAFMFGSLGYVYEVIGRIVYYFYFFAIMYGAYIMNKNDRIQVSFGVTKLALSKIMIFAYFSLQLMIWVLSNPFDFLEKYTFIWS